MTSAPAPDARVVVGRIAGAFGVRGWVRLQSFTDPLENLVHYSDWCLTGPCGAVGRFEDGAADGAGEPSSGRPVLLAAWQWHGDRLIGRIDGVDDRDGAAALVDALISVPRAQLPPPGANSYYWADLLGVQVTNLEGFTLGRLEDVMDNGAQDLMVVRGDDGRERLIPFVRDAIVKAVDLGGRRLLVDWGIDY